MLIWLAHGIGLTYTRRRYEFIYFFFSLFSIIFQCTKETMLNYYQQYGQIENVQFLRTYDERNYDAVIICETSDDAAKISISHRNTEILSSNDMIHRYGSSIENLCSLSKMDGQLKVIAALKFESEPENLQLRIQDLKDRVESVDILRQFGHLLHKIVYWSDEATDETVFTCMAKNCTGTLKELELGNVIFKPKIARILSPLFESIQSLTLSQCTDESKSLLNHCKNIIELKVWNDNFILTENIFPKLVSFSYGFGCCNNPLKCDDTVPTIKRLKTFLTQNSGIKKLKCEKIVCNDIQNIIFELIGTKLKRIEEFDCRLTCVQHTNFENNIKNISKLTSLKKLKFYWESGNTNEALFLGFLNELGKRKKITELDLGTCCVKPNDAIIDSLCKLTNLTVLEGFPYLPMKKEYYDKLRAHLPKIKVFRNERHAIK